MNHEPTTDNTTRESPAAHAGLARLQQRLTEAFDELWDNFVDPDEPYFDADGSRWGRVGGEGLSAGAAAVAFDEPQLAEIRGQCRALAVSNEFAINGHENRICYIVGTGHTYRASPRRRGRDADRAGRRGADGRSTSSSASTTGTSASRKSSAARTATASASCGSSSAADGTTRVRFVEPDQVATPPERSRDPPAASGIQTDRADVETVLGYWIDGRLVDAGEIQHRKANVDANVKRGLPLFYPVRKNLRRAEKLLRNMSVVAEIQSAIAVDPQASRGHRRGAGAVRPRPGRRQRHQPRPPDAPAISAATGRARSSTPWPAPSTSSPPPASTPAAT